MTDCDHYWVPGDAHSDWICVNCGERADIPDWKDGGRSELLAPLEKMTIAQLRAYARDAGYSSITRLDRKYELIKAIRRQQES